MQVNLHDNFSDVTSKHIQCSANGIVQFRDSLLVRSLAIIDCDSPLQCRSCSSLLTRLLGLTEPNLAWAMSLHVTKEMFQ